MHPWPGSWQATRIFDLYPVTRSAAIGEGVFVLRDHYAGVPDAIGTDCALLVIVQHDDVDTTRQHASEIIFSKVQR